MEKEKIGLFIVIIGVLFSIFTSFLCKSLCRGQCINEGGTSCLFLFLFSAICLIVSGASLIITKNPKND